MYACMEIMEWNMFCTLKKIKNVPASKGSRKTTRVYRQAHNFSTMLSLILVVMLPSFEKIYIIRGV